MPLTLKLVENKTAFKRPQMPKPPFPYKEEKVVYQNLDHSIQFGATLTLPPSEQDVPTVILITGSGQQDRDETIFGHKLFWVLADHLSRHGIAVLRVDDRGIGETTGDAKNATSADFAQDVLAGIAYLKSHKGIDVKRIGLIGHSEGGIIAPLVAHQSQDVAFIVSLAGVGVSGLELINAQSRSAFVKMGLNPSELKRIDGLNKMMFDLGNQYLDINEVMQVFAPTFENWRKQQPEDFLLKAGLKGPNTDQTIRVMAERFFSPWM